MVRTGVGSERNFQAISGKAEVEYAEKVENNEEISEMYHYAMTNFDADEVKLHMMECFFKTQKYLQSIECFEATLGYGKEKEREEQGGDEMMTGTQTAKKNRTRERDNDATMNATIVPLKYHLFKAKAHHALGHTQKAMREYEFVFKKGRLILRVRAAFNIALASGRPACARDFQSTL